MPYARKNLLTWQKGMYYHIYNRGVSKSPIFREEANYLFVLGKMKEVCREKQLSMIAYCLEPNHYHFSVRQAANILPGICLNTFSIVIQKPTIRSTNTVARPFEGRFRAKPIQNSSHLLHLCRYIHGNPVKDGLVENPADWPYSNYLEWIGERKGSLVDHAFIKEQFGNAEEYIKFLFEYLKSRQLPDDALRFINELEK